MVFQDEAYVALEGSTILLTGVTGFLGKVVLEELFRRRSELNLDKVIVITRPKKGIDAQSRFLKEVISSACFSNLPTGWSDSVQVVEGDLSFPNCGIKDLILKKITSEITHIIHCAGCISFESPLVEALAANVTSSMNICDLAHSCPSLRRLTMTSTAYVQPHRPGPIYEEIVSLPYPASEILSDIQSSQVSESYILRFTGHQNTYTLTKCLSENLITDLHSSLPITIVRPSIISASRQFPSPGWIDSHAAFAAFVAAFGSGILHVIDGNPNARGDIIPVDDVSRVLINETMFNPSTSPSSKPRILFAVAGIRNCIQWSLCVRSITTFYLSRPLGPRGPPKLSYFGPKNLSYKINNLIYHTLPYYMAGWWYTLIGDKKMAVKMGKVRGLVDTINRVFPYFVHNSFDFRAREDCLGEGFDQDCYVGMVCEGIERNLLRKVRR